MDTPVAPRWPRLLQRSCRARTTRARADRATLAAYGAPYGAGRAAAGARAAPTRRGRGADPHTPLSTPDGTRAPGG